MSGARTARTEEDRRRLADDEVTRRLTTVWGIGAWTTQMFLIFKLGRPDVMPAGDLGVQEGLRISDGLDERPTPELLMGAGFLF